MPPYSFNVRLETGHDSAPSSVSPIPGFTAHTLSDSLWIYCFFTLESGFKSTGLAAELAGCVWTEGVSAKKKLQIKKYRDTCGQVLRFMKWLLTNSTGKINVLSFSEFLSSYPTYYSTTQIKISLWNSVKRDATGQKRTTYGVPDDPKSNYQEA